MDCNIAVVGATGVVGRVLLQILEEIGVPARFVSALASRESFGKEVGYGDSQRLLVGNLENYNFSHSDIAFFVAGSAVSHKFAKKAADCGCIVIDNSSCFRMQDGIPLIIPEVNPVEIEEFKNHGIIANPNCSTIQMLVALKPLHDFAKIKRIFVSTYQSVSGAGSDAMDELYENTKHRFVFSKREPQNFPKPIEFNCIPQIGEINEDGFTDEETKMINETKKILKCEDIEIIPTCVRVPVFMCHGESISVEFEDDISLEDAYDVLTDADGVVFSRQDYKTQAEVAGYNDVFVSRLRRNSKNLLSMWVVTDNLRKGGALNAVQIAQTLTKNPLFKQKTHSSLYV